MASGISRQRRFRTLYFLVAIIAGAIASALTDSLLEEHPRWLLIIALALSIAQPFVFVLGIYYSRFWERAPRTGRATLWWILVAVILLLIMMLTGFIAYIGIEELWRQQPGEMEGGINANRNLIWSALLIKLYVILSAIVFFGRRQIKSMVFGDPSRTG